MTATHDVIVVGGGAVGAGCARELARAGRRVLVLERGERGGEAWRAAAGMLAPQIEARQEHPLFELGLAARDRYRELADALRESTGIDIGLWQEGIARVATGEAEALDIRATVAWQRQQGHLCDWLDADEVAAQWPWLGPSHGALWAPREGAIDPQRLVHALLGDAERHGARVVQDEVTAVEIQGDRVTGVSGRERYAAEEIVIAGGAWSGRLMGLPRPLSVEPVRGQMLALPWPAEIPHSIVFGRHGYLVARGDEAIVGSTMEFAGFDASVSSQGLSQLVTGVSALCPALARLEVTRSWAGLRPMAPDGLPIIGREPRVRGLSYATGHGRNGILLAGITGVIVAQILAGGESSFEEELRVVAPERFWNW